MEILAVITAFSAVATLAVLLRLYTRFWVVKAPGVDDCLVVAALMADWVFYAFAVVEIYHGLGRPNETLSVRDIRAGLQALYIVIPFYNLSLTLTKLSMAVLYMRIFPTPDILLALRLLLAAIAVIGLWMVLSSFLFCIPVEAFWKSRISTEHCLPQQVWYLNAALQITTDVVIVVFPMPVLGRLRVSRRERWAMVVVFGVGVFVCVVSAIRLYNLTVMVRSRDLTQTNGPATIWSALETNVAIICSCLPALHPLLVRILHRVLPRRLLSWSKSRSRSRSEEREGEGPPEWEVDGVAVEESDTASRSRSHRERFGVDEEGDGYAVDNEDSADMEEEYLTWAERRERKMRRREWETGA